MIRRIGSVALSTVIGAAMYTALLHADDDYTWSHAVGAALLWAAMMSIVYSVIQYRAAIKERRALQGLTKDEERAARRAFRTETVPVDARVRWGAASLAQMSYDTWTSGRRTATVMFVVLFGASIAFAASGQWWFWPFPALFVAVLYRMRTAPRRAERLISLFDEPTTPVG